MSVVNKLCKYVFSSVMAVFRCDRGGRYDMLCSLKPEILGHNILQWLHFHLLWSHIVTSSIPDSVFRGFFLWIQKKDHGSHLYGPSGVGDGEPPGAGAPVRGGPLRTRHHTPRSLYQLSEVRAIVELKLLRISLSFTLGGFSFIHSVTTTTFRDRTVEFVSSRNLSGIRRDSVDPDTHTHAHSRSLSQNTLTIKHYANLLAPFPENLYHNLNITHFYFQPLWGIAFLYTVFSF